MVDFAEIEKTALNDVEKYSKIYEEASLFNTEKVMKAFRNHMVSDYYLNLQPVMLIPMLGERTLMQFTQKFSIQKQRWCVLSL